MVDDYPRLVSDPQAEGLPDTADDESTAYDAVRSGRQSDGPDPAALPADRAANRYGTTAEEQWRGETLDQRLAQEEPDFGAGAGDDAVLVADVVEPGPEYDPHSKVSLYDRPDIPGTTGRPVGRLVEPDQGWLSDEEKDAVAYDAGAAGGGPTAEELAMHETPPPD